MSSKQGAAKSTGAKPRGRPVGSKNKTSTASDSAKKSSAKGRESGESSKAGAKRVAPPRSDDLLDDMDLDDFEMEDSEPQEQVVEAQDDEEVDDPPKTIPPLLLTRLLHEFFEKDTTRITKDANAAVAKYMDVFIKETIARVAAERDGGFFEVEDLEKIAPQLLLDL